MGDHHCIASACGEVEGAGEREVRGGGGEPQPRVTAIYRRSKQLRKTGLFPKRPGFSLPLSPSLRSP